MRVIGYVRLSKAENGHGIKVQREAIEAFCARREFELVRIEEDLAASGRSTRKRPGLAQTIEACQKSEVEAIISTRVDRLARSSLDFHTIAEKVTKAGATVLFTEQEGFSLNTPEGKMLIGILATFAAFEADLISQRTKAALAHVKKHGSKSGKKIGNPAFHSVDKNVAQKIRGLREHGMSYDKIAELLTSEGIPTVQGGVKWYGATVRNVVLRT